MCNNDPGHEAIHLASYDGWFADRIHEAAETLQSRYTANGIGLVASTAVDAN